MQPQRQSCPRLHPNKRGVASMPSQKSKPKPTGQKKPLPLLKPLRLCPRKRRRTSGPHKVAGTQSISPNNVVAAEDVVEERVGEVVRDVVDLVEVTVGAEVERGEHGMAKGEVLGVGVKEDEGGEE